MNVSELIRRWRVQVNDAVEPYFVQDETVIDLLNDAENEACIRGRLLLETVDPDITTIDVQEGVGRYETHVKLYEIVKAWFAGTTSHRYENLCMSSIELMDNEHRHDWRSEKGVPRVMIQLDTALQLHPIPRHAGKIRLEGYRLPLRPLVDVGDEPEINQAHHIYLLSWVSHKAFAIPDSEFFDAERSLLALADFEQYFGLRPDSGLRRSTRYDLPQTVTPFMP